jgi:hypothetical protein
VQGLAQHADRTVVVKARGAQLVAPDQNLQLAGRGAQQTDIGLVVVHWLVIMSFIDR